MSTLWALCCRLCVAYISLCNMFYQQVCLVSFAELSSNSDPLPSFTSLSVCQHETDPDPLLSFTSLSVSQHEKSLPLTACPVLIDVHFIVAVKWRRWL